MSQQKQITIEDKYRAVLCSQVGLDVLADLLSLLEWPSTIEPGDERKVVAHNLALNILRKCGLVENSTELIARMLGVRTTQTQNRQGA